MDSLGLNRLKDSRCIYVLVQDSLAMVGGKGGGGFGLMSISYTTGAKERRGGEAPT